VLPGLIVTLDELNPHAESPLREQLEERVALKATEPVFFTPIRSLTPVPLSTVKVHPEEEQVPWKAEPFRSFPDTPII
jgi:hypothetical protein